MKNKDAKKLRKRLKRLEARLDHMLAQEKRLVDLVVRLTTENVCKSLERQFDEKRLVDAIVRHSVDDLRRVLDQQSIDPERLADAIAKRLAR